MRRGIGGLALVVILAIVAAGCGGGGSSTSTTTTGSSSTTSTASSGAATSASATASAIRDAWKTFFDGATPVAQRVALLADGQRFSATIKALSQNPLASKTSATISKVKVTGPTTASVTFTVYLAGLPVLKNVKGTAVLANGAWLVDAGSLCKLLVLQGSTPAACSSASKSP